MRMRKKRNGNERISACADFLIPKEATFTEILQFFPGKDLPLRLEIGCGKGSFACGTVEREGGFSLLAVERVPDVACLALEKAKTMAESGEMDGDRLRFMITNVDPLLDRMPDGCLSVIYLNFSDPWPKKGHAKRRLTHRNYLAKYTRLLCEGGELRVKTDNDGLYAFTLEELAECDSLEIIMQTEDLHASEYAEGNVVTEYEQRFSEMGKNINSVRARRK